jgi:tetratricopeptide (TPR) repeat protein
MKNANYFLLFVLFLIVGCPGPQPYFEKLPEHVQAISLLGDTLKTNSNVLPESLITRIDSLKNAAIDRGDSASVIIWEARKLGYEGRYREAISVLQASSSFNIEQTIARNLRHIGHRYITLRAFDHAIGSFNHASDFMASTPDRMEEDGLPNSKNIPLSSLHTNVWYHLGLAYFLKGNFEKASETYEKGLEAAQNEDMRIAMRYWQYITLRKMGKDEQAAQVLSAVNPDLEIIENQDYLKLLLVFKGVFDPELLLVEEEDALGSATIGYGLGY